MSPSTGDIFKEQSFECNNNQTAASNINGFIFDNNIVRYFHAFASIHIVTNTSSFDAGYELKGIQTQDSWLLNTSFIGNNNPLSFKINNTGQIQYTSSNIPDWISSTIKFRALTTSV